ncbi:MAG: restriction endonuclease subunit S [Desulfobulbus sp.]|nr:restriction endonuclease subunit S [Desulfobulbus sp.]
MSSELRRLWEHAGGQVPDAWKIVPLESLLCDNKSIAVGVMYPGPDTPGGTPLIKVGDIKDGTVPIKPSYCISDKTNKEHKRTQLIGDELLITLVGNPGECVVVSPAMAGWNPARAIATIRLQEPNLRIYLKAVLESTASKHLIDAVLNTTVQKTLNLKDIRKLPIPLPPKQTILDISEIAAALTDRIALLCETNSILESIAQTLFKSWFTDFDPVHAKQQGSEPEGMDSTTAALFPDSFEESEIGKVPTGWRVGTLGDLAKFQNGYAFKSKDWVNSGHPVVKIGDVKPRIIDLTGCSFVAAETTTGLGRFQLNRGDLLVGMTGYVGETGLVPALDSTAYLNQRVGRISTLNGLHDIGFVYCLARNPLFKLYAETQSHGSAQANVGGATLLGYTTTIPTEAILEKFNSILYVLINKILTNHEQAQTLVGLRDTLLPRLISGQLRMPDAEALAEEATS